MSISDYQEFVFVFYQPVMLIAVAFLIVASMALGLLTMVRLINEA